jgi:hypothetical protein
VEAAGGIVESEQVLSNDLLRQNVEFIHKQQFVKVKI